MQFSHAPYRVSVFMYMSVCLHVRTRYVYTRVVSVGSFSISFLRFSFMCVDTLARSYLYTPFCMCVFTCKDSLRLCHPRSLVNGSWSSNPVHNGGE